MLAALGATLSIGVSGAHAACGGTNSYAACSDVNISLLYIEATSNAYIQVDGNPQALPCTLNGGYITLPGSAPRFNAVYATLLTAHSTKRKVTIRVTPNEANQCVVAYVTLAAQ